MKKTKRISQSFQTWLSVVIVIAFLVTTACLWVIQTKLSENNAINLLALNISDVREDIIDASDDNLLKLTYEIAEELGLQDKVGSYGWGDGEWMRSWEADCRDAGLALACDCVICNDAPGDAEAEECKALGRALAQS